MLTRNECWIFSIKTFIHFKCNIEIDLDFYVRVRTCEKRVTGKRPLKAGKKLFATRPLGNYKSRNSDIVIKRFK